MTGTMTGDAAGSRFGPYTGGDRSTALALLALVQAADTAPCSAK